jgi:hypothetical protein
MTKLQLFRSLWGCDAHAPFRALSNAGDKLALLRSAGYEGIEASLADLGSCREERRDMVEALREANMGLIVGAYSSWTDYDESNWRDLHSGVDEQLSRFELQLREVDELNADSLLHRVNVHSGSDAWSEENTRQYFNRALSLGAQLPISHETHRGRPLANPFICHRLCQEFPELRLTLDASHWFLVCERLLGSTAAAEEGSSTNWESSVLALLCERVDHIHARIGTPESPQLGAMPISVEEGGTTWENESAAAHEALWLQVWRNKLATGDIITATPEYGPAPYTPMAAKTGEPLTDVWEVTNDASGRLQKLFVLAIMTQ